MNNGFISLEISENLIEILSKNMITDPTPIQQQAIPVLLNGKDLIAQAQTGTGKTLAFLLPVMQKIEVNADNVQALIITPTRELALQITQVAKMLAEACGANILAAYGGQDMRMQKKKLQKRVHIVIGTPGRLLDHINRRAVNFTGIKTLVLDEADLMLDMGFQHDVEKIIHHSARRRQTVLCSATMPEGITSLAEKHLTSPVKVNITGNTPTISKIRQIAIETTDKNKKKKLTSALDEYKPFMAIIFCRTKRRAESLNKVLKERGYKSDELHGNLTQAKREKVMKAFRNSKVQYLVATDIAARGLDVEGVTHVFNYDMPDNTESYIHRIGRTGRAGKDGFSITLFTDKDKEDLFSIEKGVKCKIEIILDNTANATKEILPKEISVNKTLLSENEDKHIYSSGKKKNNFSGTRTHSKKSGFKKSNVKSYGRKTDSQYMVS